MTSEIAKAIADKVLDANNWVSNHGQRVSLWKIIDGLNYEDCTVGDKVRDFICCVFDHLDTLAQQHADEVAELRKKLQLWKDERTYFKKEYGKLRNKLAKAEKQLKLAEADVDDMTANSDASLSMAIHEKNRAKRQAAEELAIADKRIAELEAERNQLSEDIALAPWANQIKDLTDKLAKAEAEAKDARKVILLYRRWEHASDVDVMTGDRCDTSEMLTEASFAGQDFMEKYPAKDSSTEATK